MNYNILEYISRNIHETITVRQNKGLKFSQQIKVVRFGRRINNKVAPMAYVLLNSQVANEMLHSKNSLGQIVIM